jgi:hypothetical protein
MNAQINQTAYTMLVTMATDAAKTAAEVSKAKDKLDAAKEKAKGPYDNAVEAAIACKTRAVFDATIGALMDNVRMNRGGLAVKLKAEKRDAVGKNGETHKVPGSISSAKTVLLFAMEHGVPLEIDGKPRAFSQIREENSHVRELDNEKKAAERKANAQGAEKALYAAEDAVRALLAALPAMSEDWLNEVTAFAVNAVKEAKSEAAKSNGADKSATVGEQLAA